MFNVCVSHMYIGSLCSFDNLNSADLVCRINSCCCVDSRWEILHFFLLLLLLFGEWLFFCSSLSFESLLSILLYHQEKNVSDIFIDIIADRLLIPCSRKLIVLFDHMFNSHTNTNHSHMTRVYISSQFHSMFSCIKIYRFFSCHPCSS